MPSGKVHDLITLMLAPPVLAVGYAATHSFSLAAISTIMFVFGGLMFGPDLDTASKQYSRWGIFRLFWFPYRSFFKHRSRWSHGLICGTLLRVIYFMGVITLTAFVTAYTVNAYSGGELPAIGEFAKSWQAIGDTVSLNLGKEIFPAVFAGMWTGAASHTFTDLAGSYIKTGRITEFL